MNNFFVKSTRLCTEITGTFLHHGKSFCKFSLFLRATLSR